MIKAESLRKLSSLRVFLFAQRRTADFVLLARLSSRGKQDGYEYLRESCFLPQVDRSRRENDHRRKSAKGMEERGRRRSERKTLDEARLLRK